MKVNLQVMNRIWTLGLSAGLLAHCGKIPSSAELKSEAPTYVNIAGAAANILPGVGFDSAREKVHDFCLEQVGELQTLPGTGNGKNVVFEFDKLTSEKTLSDKLNIATSMSVDYLAGGASAKFDFTKSHVSSENSVTITVNARVINSERTLGKVTLTKEAQDLYSANPIAFYDRCGDSFVSGIRTGGEFHAVFEYVGLTSEEKQKIEAGFSAHYLSVKADGHMSLENESLLKSSKLRVRIIQSGGEIVTSTSIDEFKAAAENFARSVTAVDANGKPGNAWAMEVTLKGYDKIVTPSVENAKKFTQLRAVRPIFLALVQKANHWLDLKSQIDYVGEHTSEFEAFDVKTLNRYRSITQTQIETIKTSMDVCLENILQCTLPKLDDASQIKLPKMKVIPTAQPMVVRIRLVSKTKDENEDRNKGYAVFLINEQGTVVARATGVSVGEEYPENTEHSVDIPLTMAFSPKGLFTARVVTQYGNDWNSSFYLSITYKDHDEIKVMNTDETGVFHFRDGANSADWLVTLK